MMKLLKYWYLEVKIFFLRLKDFIPVTLLAILASLAMACTGYKYQEDNVVEEIVELGIKEELGVDVDLSPSTPEKGFSPKHLAPIKKEDLLQSKLL